MAAIRVLHLPELLEIIFSYLQDEEDEYTAEKNRRRPIKTRSNPALINCLLVNSVWNSVAVRVLWAELPDLNVFCGIPRDQRGYYAQYVKSFNIIHPRYCWRTRKQAPYYSILYPDSQEQAEQLGDPDKDIENVMHIAQTTWYTEWPKLEKVSLVAIPTTGGILLALQLIPTHVKKLHIRLVDEKTDVDHEINLVQKMNFGWASHSEYETDSDSPFKKGLFNLKKLSYSMHTFKELEQLIVSRLPPKDMVHFLTAVCSMRNLTYLDLNMGPEANILDCHLPEVAVTMSKLTHLSLYAIPSHRIERFLKGTKNLQKIRLWIEYSFPPEPSRVQAMRAALVRVLSQNPGLTSIEHSFRIHPDFWRWNNGGRTPYELFHFSREDLLRIGRSCTGLQEFACTGHGQSYADLGEKTILEFAQHTPQMRSFMMGVKCEGLTARTLVKLCSAWPRLHTFSTETCLDFSELSIDGAPRLPGLKWLEVGLPAQTYSGLAFRTPEIARRWFESLDFNIPNLKYLSYTWSSEHQIYKSSLKLPFSKEVIDDILHADPLRRRPLPAPQDNEQSQDDQENGNEDQGSEVGELIVISEEDNRSAVSIQERKRKRRRRLRRCVVM